MKGFIRTLILAAVVGVCLPALRAEEGAQTQPTAEKAKVGKTLREELDAIGRSREKGDFAWREFATRIDALAEAYPEKKDRLAIYTYAVDYRLSNKETTSASGIAAYCDKGLACEPDAVSEGKLCMRKGMAMRRQHEDDSAEALKRERKGIAETYCRAIKALRSKGMVLAESVGDVDRLVKEKEMRDGEADKGVDQRMIGRWGWACRSSLKAMYFNKAEGYEELEGVMDAYFKDDDAVKGWVRLGIIKRGR